MLVDGILGIIKRSDHPNIIKFIDISIIPGTEPPVKLCIMLSAILSSVTITIIRTRSGSISQHSCLYRITLSMDTR